MATEEEIRKQEEIEKNLDKLQDELSKKEIQWNEKITKFAKRLNDELVKSIGLSADVISHRQELLEERTQCYYNLYKMMPKIKQATKDRLEYYSTKSPIKFNGTEKQKMIDGDLAYHEAKIEILQNYISFLTESIKNVDNISYAIKNKIDFYNLSGIE